MKPQSLLPLELRPLAENLGLRLFKWHKASGTSHEKYHLEFNNAWLADAVPNQAPARPGDYYYTLTGETRNCILFNAGSSNEYYKRHEQQILSMLRLPATLAITTMLAQAEDSLEEKFGAGELAERYIRLAVAYRMPWFELIKCQPYMLDMRNYWKLGLPSTPYRPENDKEAERVLAVIKAAQQMKTVEEAKEMVDSYPASWVIKTVGWQ